MEPNVKKFIKKELKKGIKPASIKKALVKQGYDEKEVEKNLKETRNDIKILIFIVVAIAIALVFVFLFLFKPTSDSNANVGDNKPLLAGNYTDEELLNMALLKKDVAYCEYITSDRLRISCEALASSGETKQTDLERKDELLLNKAVLDKNPALCEMITYETTRENCKTLAQPTPESAPDPDEELLNQAVLQKDPSKCLLIQSERLRISCQALVS